MEYVIKFLTDYSDVSTAIIALCALIVSFISVLLSFFSFYIQRSHNHKSVTPIASIGVSDYENLIEIEITNNGIGPMLVTKFKVFSEIESDDDLISFMPELPQGITWDTFYANIDGLCIPPNQSISLLRLSGDETDKLFSNFRDLVRQHLSKLSLELTYKDIYKRKMPLKQRSLSWYKRNI